MARGDVGAGALPAGKRQGPVSDLEERLNLSCWFWNNLLRSYLKAQKNQADVTHVDGVLPFSGEELPQAASPTSLPHLAQLWV